MSIKIPETVQKYCESEEATKAIDLLLEKNLEGKTLEEKAQYYKAHLFLEHFLYDMWYFRYEIFKAVWGELLEDFNMILDETDWCELEESNYIFAQKYDLNGQKYHLGVISVDYKNNLCVFMTKIGEDGLDYSIGKSEQFPKGLNLNNEKFDDSDEYYTYGSEIALKNKTKITDKEVLQLKKDAENMLNFITKHKNKNKKK